MRYAIRHTTSFVYDSPVRESVMELRMRPASLGPQHCLQFEVDVQPAARIFAYTDFQGNWVHHFDIPRRHSELTVIARAEVQLDAPVALPETLPTLSNEDAWGVVDGWSARGEYWHFRQPSHFAVWTPALLDFASSIDDAKRERADPLTAVRTTMSAIHGGFEYAPASTHVDSPIDDALNARRGVCQDFAHLMIAMLRLQGLPARYVSGYAAPSKTEEGSDPSSIATHAWVEVMLPELGWVGVDPTHNVPAGLRHVRVAIGRDYADVPPTRGVFKGNATSTLSVSVEITPGGALPTLDPAVIHSERRIEAVVPADREHARQHTQQQQQ
jgi:transglutaminase-like putative cysteine protease